MTTYKELSEKIKFAFPDYPAQLPSKDDNDDWVTGDPSGRHGIVFPVDGKKRTVSDVASILSKASGTIKKDRKIPKKDPNI